MSTPTVHSSTAADLHQYENLCVEWSKETIDALEPLLSRNMRRFVLFPIKYLALWRAYKHAVSTFWIADSIDVSRDMLEWQMTCTTPHRRIVGTLLLVLEATDAIHGQLFSTIAAMTTSPEARCFFGFQGMIENVHREALAKLVAAFVPYQGTGEGSPARVESMGTLERKLSWITEKSEDQTALFSEKVLLFLFIQGLFTASTAAIFKEITQKSVLRCLVNTYNKISVDRETHINFATLLFYHLQRRPSARYAVNLITEMVEIERSFAEELIRSMDIDILPIYAILRDIECVADGLLASVGYSSVYIVEDQPLQTDVDRKVTGGLKALYFEQEMSTAYPYAMSSPGDNDYLTFDLEE